MNSIVTHALEDIENDPSVGDWNARFRTKREKRELERLISLGDENAVLTKSQFLEFVDYPLTKEKYTKFLEDNQHVKKSRAQGR
jgi:hypothetical protein